MLQPVAGISDGKGVQWFFRLLASHDHICSSEVTCLSGRWLVATMNPCSVGFSQYGVD